MDSIYKKEFREYYITYIFIIINIVIFLLMELAGGSNNTKVLILFGAKVNALIDLGEYWRLLTSVFIHIGFTHLLFNVYGLIALGKYAEMIFGHVRFLLVYLTCGICGSFLSYLMSPSLSAGASGAIFGLLGAIVAYGWKNQYLWRSGLIKSLLIVLGINLFLGILLPGIDNFGHLGGLIAGFTIGFVLRVVRTR